MIDIEGRSCTTYNGHTTNILELSEFTTQTSSSGNNAGLDIMRNVYKLIQMGFPSSLKYMRLYKIG